MDKRLAICTRLIIGKKIPRSHSMFFKLKTVGTGHGDTVYYGNVQ